MNEDAQVREWAPVAERVAARFYLPGADRDDVRQEALIALWHGLRAFDGRGDKGAFLGMCVRRRLVSKLQEAQALKHDTLTGAVRHGPFELVPDQHGPHELAVARERLDSVVAAVRALSPAQREAVAYAVNGWRYYGNRSVDNHLQKARRKLRAAA